LGGRFIPISRCGRREGGKNSSIAVVEQKKRIHIKERRDERGELDLKEQKANVRKKVLEIVVL
jgi:hypothetical protein